MLFTRNIFCWFLLTWSVAAAAQPLRVPPDDLVAAPPQTSIPLIFRSAAGPETLPDVQSVLVRLHNEIRDVAQSSLSSAVKQAAMEKLLADNMHVFGPHAANQPKTAAEAAERLEQMLFDVALEVAPTEASRERVLTNTPAQLFPEPNRPILIANDTQRPEIIVTRDAEAKGVSPWWRQARVNVEALELKEVKETPDTPPKEAEDKGADTEQDSAAPQVAVLADAAATVEMHDDTTVLRNVTSDAGDLVLFGAVHIWAGGAIQYDAYRDNDLFDARAEGSSDDGNYVRRGEVILRASYKEYGELKLQYDLESNIWRDLYWRSVNEAKSRSITIGNQDEPMGLDYLLGNKFSTAMEKSAPASAFAAYGGMGVRLSNWFERDSQQLLLRREGDSSAYMTSSIGLFTQDLENSDNTDVALTGRVTSGRIRANGMGLHLGGSMSLRKADYDRIAPRPGMYDVDRIPLAKFSADQQVVVGLEAAVSRGSLHAQAEAYISDYRGGTVDAYGYGGYAQVGWLFNGERRTYRPKWGLWAPLDTKGRSVFEVFARASYTYGNSDSDSSNDLGLLTVGGNWYYKKFRFSINGFYSAVNRDVGEESSGLGMAVRGQYLF